MWSGKEGSDMGYAMVKVTKEQWCSTMPCPEGVHRDGVRAEGCRSGLGPHF